MVPTHLLSFLSLSELLLLSLLPECLPLMDELRLLLELSEEDDRFPRLRLRLRLRLRWTRLSLGKMGTDDLEGTACGSA